MTDGRAAGRRRNDIGMRVYPFFIPHQGCPQRCVYCRQEAVAGMSTAPAPAAVPGMLDAMLPVRGDGEVAFFGGSFSALSAPLQEAYLRAVAPFLAAGRVAGIRVSTRPDACDPEAVERLRRHGVTTVELGCQSFSARVLTQSGRGHGPRDACGAASRLRAAGLRLGLQLMPGLPGADTREARRSLARALALRPDFLRLYPTVVLRHTLLEKWWRQGRYSPMPLLDAVALCAELLWRSRQAGVPVIRLGLQSSPELHGPDGIVAGPYHPAFGHLVKSYLWRRALNRLLTQRGCQPLTVHPSDVADVRGHRNGNLLYLQRRFGPVTIQVQERLERDSLRVGARLLNLWELARFPVIGRRGCPSFSVESPLEAGSGEHAKG